MCALQGPGVPQDPAPVVARYRPEHGPSSRNDWIIIKEVKKILFYLDKNPFFNLKKKMLFFFFFFQTKKKFKMADFSKWLFFKIANS